MPHPSPNSTTRTDGDRILLVRLSAHGDVIHTLPLLAAIKRDKPQAFVGWLVDEAAAPLLENHPLIDRLHVSQTRRWAGMLKNPLRWAQAWQEIASLVSGLKQAGYTVNLDVQGLLKSAIWPVLASIPRRCGFAKTRESADLFYTDKLPPIQIRNASTPAVHQFLTLATAVGCRAEAPVFVTPPVSPETQARVDAFLAAAEKGRPLVILAPFTRWASKHWRFEHWVALMRELSDLDVQLAMLGGPGDDAEARRMLAALSSDQGSAIINLVGRTQWPDLYALFERAHVVIGLDSAPIHIANAVGAPHLIGIYGPTAPGRTGPIGDKQVTLATQLSCQPCYQKNYPIRTHDCMARLTPDQVLAEVRRALSERALAS